MCTFFMTYCTSSYSLYVSAQTKKPPKKPRACSALCLCIVHVTFQGLNPRSGVAGGAAKGGMTLNLVLNS